VGFAVLQRGRGPFHSCGPLLILPVCFYFLPCVHHLLGGVFFLLLLSLPLRGLRHLLFLPLHRAYPSFDGAFSGAKRRFLLFSSFLPRRGHRSTTWTSSSREGKATGGHPVRRLCLLPCHGAVTAFFLCFPLLRRCVFATSFSAASAMQRMPSESGTLSVSLSSHPRRRLLPPPVVPLLLSPIAQKRGGGGRDRDGKNIVHIFFILHRVLVGFSLPMFGPIASAAAEASTSMPYLTIPCPLVFLRPFVFSYHEGDRGRPFCIRQGVIRPPPSRFLRLFLPHPRRRRRGYDRSERRGTNGRRRRRGGA